MESSNLRIIEEQLQKLSQAEILDLAARLIALAQERADPHQTDLSRYRGILKSGTDPLDYQRTIRAEWDRG